MLFHERRSYFNPLPSNVYICYRIGKVLILKKKGSRIKFRMIERRTYESVDERSLSKAESQKMTGKRSLVEMG